MILVKRSSVTVFAILVFVAFLAFGGVAWYFCMQAASLDEATRKFIAERFLFFCILAALFFLIFGITMITRSINFSRALEKLVRLSRMGNYSPDSELRKLGTTGSQLADILYEMNRLSEKKSIKIGTLHVLAEYLTENISTRTLILSAAGTIQYASKSLLTDIGLEKKELAGRQIDDVFPDYGIHKATEELFQEKTKIQLAQLRGTLSPVLNHKRDAVFAVCEFRPAVPIHSAIPSTVKKRSVTEGAGKRISDGVKNVLGFFTREKKKE